jgi:Zn-dependent protease with chaperone function
MINRKMRVGSMLRLDFYRLFHTPVFFIMLAISAIIPAMLLTMTGGQTGVEYTNTWQLIESTGGSAAGANPLDFGGYANINMVFIFAGLLMAIFVAHDYLSGFAKNIFTVHAKKNDCVISKSVIGIFGGAGMIIAYIFGAVIAGFITGKSFDVNVGGLLLCIISKMFLMGIFCSLFLCVAVFFRNKLWLTIVFTFLFGMMLYPAASVATLGSTAGTALIALIAGVSGVVVIGAVSGFILNHRDLT